jgi:pimeloyl-ACP methyl ester carboxylesterase
MSDDQREVVRREAQAFGELAALHRDPVFYGRGIPRGDGRSVVVIPGLFGNDVYLQPLRIWLMRIGYSPQRSNLMINAGCPDRLRARIEQTLPDSDDHRRQPICLIGHSRGGMLAWAIASRLQERASHLALLGSPAPAVVAMMAQGGVLSPSTVAKSSVADAGARALKLLDPDCTVPNCGCPYTEDLRRPLSPATRVLSIYSRDDPIVRPQASRITIGDNIEINGSHSGLVHNRAALPPLARFLAAT